MGTITNWSSVTAWTSKATDSEIKILAELLKQIDFPTDCELSCTPDDLTIKFQVKSRRQNGKRLRLIQITYDSGRIYLGGYFDSANNFEKFNRTVSLAAYNASMHLKQAIWGIWDQLK